MKKMLIFVLIISLFMALPVSASAPVIKTDANYYDPINDAFYIKGTIENEIGNIPMTLTISYNGEVVFLAQTVAKATDGVVSYEFPKMFLPATAQSGDYEINVRSTFSTTPHTTSISYAGTDSLLPILKLVKEKIDDKDKAGLLNCLSTEKDKLIIDYDSIADLTDTNEKYFVSLMFDESYTLPDALTDVSDNLAVQEALKKLRSDIKEDLSMAQYFDIDTISEAKEWFTEYADYYGYTSEHKIFEYLPAHETTQFVTRVVPEDVRPIEKVKKVIEKTILLTNVQITDSTTVVSDIISAFPEYFTGFSPKYNKLSVSNKGSVWRHLKGTKYDTCEALVKAANEYAETLAEGSGGGGGGAGGGNWGDSAGGGYGVTGSMAVGNNGNELQLTIFTDLTQSHWAYAPMLNLYRRNIIKGYGDNTVKPDQAITRAEFIKILAEISLMPIDMTSEDFADVPATHWAYKYVKSARKAGLITGGYGNSFNPDEKITREDMLVILQRAKNAPDGTSSFSDITNASSYAVGAIGYFSSNGVVNGMGDNMFMPKENTTRAQACKILNLLYQ